ncbi:hypothetical protein NMG60_11012095 [Bertholletia excelsa]
MTKQLTSKLRLVKCPRCRKVLPEVANVPVYRCGGCDVVLQAKKRINDSKETSPCIDDPKTARKNDLEHVSHDSKAQSLREMEKPISTSELSLEKTELDQDELKDGNRKQSGDEKFSSESKELAYHENEESQAVEAETDDHQDQCSLEVKKGGDPNESGNCNEKQSGDVSLSNEGPLSTELNHHGRKESLQEAGVQSEDSEKSKGRDNYHESKKDFPLAVVHSELDENINSLKELNERNQNEFGDHERELPGNMELPNGVASSTELSYQEIEESFAVVGANTKLNEKNCCMPRSSSEENPEMVSPRDSVNTAQRSFHDNILTDNHMPLTEQLDQHQKRSLVGEDDENSVDRLDNILLAKNSSKFTLKDGSKFPITRSDYAYDGSVSSYDGNDNRAPNLHLGLSKRKLKEAESASAKAIFRKDRVTNRIRNCYPEMQNQAWNCSSLSSDKKRYAMKGKKDSEDEFLESTRHGQLFRSRMTFEMPERPSGVPFYSRACQVDYEKGGPSNYRQNKFKCSTSSHARNQAKSHDWEKMELLQFVHELRDELNRRSAMRGKANERCLRCSRMEKQVPTYYDHTETEEETCHHVRNTRSHMRMPFSAEATTSRHPAGPPCLHCCPHGCKWSAPLPPHVCCNKTRYATRSHPRCLNMSSCRCEPEYDDHWHKNHQEVKKYHPRERNHVVKRHVRPMVGGAPFLACYACSKLLQLPADFLLYGKRRHQLRCSACSVILKFSLQSGTHIIRYTDFAPAAVAPPPSEVNDSTDEHGPSLHKSCSTEGEPFSVTVPVPIHALKGGSEGIKMSSASSFGLIENAKAHFMSMESQNKYKNPVKSFASAGTSSMMSRTGKVSSENGGLLGVSGSPLHKLMGYASATEMMNNC